MTTGTIAATYSARVGTNGLFAVVGEGEFVVHANAFLATVTQRGFSPRTVRAYAHDLVVFFRWLSTTPYQLADIGERGLLEYVGVQRQEEAQSRSINRRLSSCKLLIRFVSGREPERGTRPGTTAVLAATRTSVFIHFGRNDAWRYG